MATFSGHTEFFEIVSRVDELGKTIKVKEDEIEAVKKEYGLDGLEISSDPDLSHSTSAEPAAAQVVDETVKTEEKV